MSAGISPTIFAHDGDPSSSSPPVVQLHEAQTLRAARGAGRRVDSRRDVPVGQASPTIRQGRRRRRSACRESATTPPSARRSSRRRPRRRARAASRSPPDRIDRAARKANSSVPRIVSTFRPLRPRSTTTGRVIATPPAQSGGSVVEVDVLVVVELLVDVLTDGSNVTVHVRVRVSVAPAIAGATKVVSEVVGRETISYVPCADGVKLKLGCVSPGIGNAVDAPRHADRRPARLEQLHGDAGRSREVDRRRCWAADTPSPARSCLCRPTGVPTLFVESQDVLLPAHLAERHGELPRMRHVWRGRYMPLAR